MVNYIMTLTQYLSQHGERALVDAILTHCETILGTIPAELAINNTECVLAGQAVASAIYEILDTPLRGQLNDLDVFLEEPLDFDGTGHNDPNINYLHTREFEPLREPNYCSLHNDSYRIVALPSQSSILVNIFGNA